MTQTTRQPDSRWRTLLIMGRVANLPTVWSNCLAGWLLTGVPLGVPFGLLLVGATCLYTGGMFLNDVCDVEFDRKHHPQRPIVSGQIPAGVVLTLAWLLLAVGVGTISSLGRHAAGASLILTTAIVAYNWLHKRWLPALGLMALCRGLLYWTAAGAILGDSCAALLPSLGLGGYVLGISLIARHETRPGPIPKWPIALLLLPVAFAIWNANPASAPQAAIACLLFLGWITRAVGPRAARKQAGNPVGKLLAGIVLVDLLMAASAAGPYWSFPIFGLLLALALLVQRRVPAT